METPIIEGTKEPRLGEREAIEKANQEYHNPEMMPLEDAKTKLRNSLYGNNEINPVEDSISQLRNSLDLNNEINGVNGDIVVAIDPTEKLSGNENVVKEEEEVKVEEVVQAEEIVEVKKPINEYDYDSIGTDKLNNDGIEKLENKRKIEENPNTPLVDGFVNQGLLTEVEGDLVKEALIKSGDIEKNIGDIKEIVPEKLTQVIKSIKYLNSNEAVLKNGKKFSNDFATEIDGLKQSIDGTDGGEKELVGQNKELIEKLGINYFPINGQEGNQQTKKEALDIAFKATLNKLMDGKNFKRPVTFDEMKGIVINSELDFGTRFKELGKIDTLINNDQSVANKGQKDRSEKGQSSREKINLSLEERFNQFQKEVVVSRENKDYKELERLLNEGNDLKEEIAKSGEIFEGSNMELLPAIQEELKEQA